MKTVYLMTKNERLYKRWETLLQERYEIKQASELETLAAGGGVVVVYHDDSQIDQLCEQLGATDLQASGLHVMVLRSLPEIEEGKRLLGLNIKGYGNANMSDASFNQAVDVLSEGNIWLYPGLMNSIVKSLGVESVKNTALKDLSEREQDVAVCVSEGLGNRQIAEKLALSESTVKGHIASIFSKLGVKNRVALALQLKKG